MTSLAPPMPGMNGEGSGAPRARARRARSAHSLHAEGLPMVWLTGGALGLALLMITGLIGLVLYQGSSTFWPSRVVEVELRSGARLMGEVTRAEEFRPNEAQIEALGEGAGAARAAVEAAGGVAERRLLRTGNFDVSGSHFNWVSGFAVEKESRPEWAMVIERMSWGRFYGVPKEFRVEGEAVATEPAAIWAALNEHHGEVRGKWRERRRLEIHEIGRVNRELERGRLRERQAALSKGEGSPEHARAREALAKVTERGEAEFVRIREQIAEINRYNNRYQLVLETADGVEKALPLAEVVRAYPANQLGVGGRTGVYLSRWWEFLTDDPREANSEGGVFPAIFGTVAMTMIMSVLVVPFGVLAALYLREYAKAGLVVSAVRVAVNNLAGVPSIVFGVFGLGFFCYLMGGTIDQLFFEAKLPSPTYGTGGIFWASLTLALLTLPVVIVATEEALAAVPSSMRDGSYGCGASKWQTIQRIVLPRAMPGIMTGAILAMARGAGEVAPLMLVGAVKLAPELPVDGVAPFVHPERSFMHLGFHIFDLGFQSQNSEAAKPMVFTTTLLLIAIIAALNLTAVFLRSRLHRRFKVSQF